jgi:sulfatase maturation enzyme AslB (radical SAM superfamily)
MTPSRTGALQFSRYLRTRDKGSWTAIFHELHPEPWHIPASIWQHLRDSGGSLPPLVTGELRQRGLLVTSPEEDDAAWAAAHRELTARLDRASILYLVLVQGCNFSCSYCPIPGLARETGNQFMAPDTARAAIDLWARHIQDDRAPGGEYCAILYGGEPLMNEPALTAAIYYIRQLQDSGDLPGDNLTIMVCTNGVLIDAQLARFFREHRVSVAVGCDGPADDHDAIRRDVHGKATYAQVAAAIKTLVAEDVTTFASASITPHNLPRISEFSDFFAGLGVAKFGFNFLRGKLLFRLVPPERLAEYYDQATDGVLANFASFGRRHLEYQVERKHLAMLERRYFPTDCNGYGNQLVIDPRGQIGHCSRPLAPEYYKSQPAADRAAGSALPIVAGRRAGRLVRRVAPAHASHPGPDPDCRGMAVGRTGRVLAMPPAAVGLDHWPRWQGKPPEPRSRARHGRGPQRHDQRNPRRAGSRHPAACPHSLRLRAR